MAARLLHLQTLKKCHRSFVELPNRLHFVHAQSRSCSAFHHLITRNGIARGAVSGVLSNSCWKSRFYSFGKERDVMDIVSSTTRSAMWSLRRMWRNYGNPGDSSEKAVWGLIGANGIVFALWSVFRRDFMERHFVISVENVRSLRLHTLLTSAFSHVELGHFFSNMLGLYFFGSSIEQSLGPKFLLNLYVAGAVVGSVFYLLHKAFIVSKDRPEWYWRHASGMGASGAVNSIILLHIFLFPRAVHYVNFFIPVPAILLGALLIGHDIWRVYQGDPYISGAAHLGGAVVATLAWARIKRGRF